MNNAKKIIQINPELFNIGKGTRRKRNSSKNISKVSKNPLLSPNIIKNRLLQKIREHKEISTNPISLKQSTLSSINTNNLSKSKVNDEWTDSMSYLQSLSLNKNKSSIPTVNLEIPNEFNIPYTTNNNVNNNTNTNNTNINNANTNANNNSYCLDNEVPYGILKGGFKPTYKTWNKTIKIHNNSIQQQNIPILEPPLIYHTKLNKLKEQLQQTIDKQDIVIKPNLITNLDTDLDIDTYIDTDIDKNTDKDIDKDIDKNIDKDIDKDIDKYIDKNTDIDILNNKQNITYIKNIKRRKFTLGRSKINHTISVLLKDNGTRKQFIKAHNDIKHTHMSEIKRYLREHNLIKVGSNAPNDILKKMYESAMLSGNIMNKTPDIMMHNLNALS